MRSSQNADIARPEASLSHKCLERRLTDCTPEECYRSLSERAFFWLSLDRLITLMSPPEYAERTHTVLYVDTAALLKGYESRVELAAVNTGNIRPFAHAHGACHFPTVE